MRGNPSINHHWSASSVMTLHDPDMDEGFQYMDPRFVSVYIMDESNQTWWGRVLSISSRGRTIKIRVTAPRHFASPDFPDRGFFTITLTYPSGFWYQFPVAVDYVDDNGCW
jgi:hypothetical protein